MNEINEIPVTVLTGLLRSVCSGFAQVSVEAYATLARLIGPRGWIVPVL